MQRWILRGLRQRIVARYRPFAIEAPPDPTSSTTPTHLRPTRKRVALAWHERTASPANGVPMTGTAQSLGIPALGLRNGDVPRQNSWLRNIQLSVHCGALDQLHVLHTRPGGVVDEDPVVVGTPHRRGPELSRPLGVKGLTPGFAPAIDRRSNGVVSKSRPSSSHSAVLTCRIRSSNVGSAAVDRICMAMECSRPAALPMTAQPHSSCPPSVRG